MEKRITQPSYLLAESYARMTGRFTLIGLMVGLAVVVLKICFVSHAMSFQSVVINMMFSLFITLAIANSVYLFERLWRPGKATGWYTIVFYYACNFLGMMIGIELSYLFVSLFFGAPFQFLTHYRDYRFSSVIVLIVGTIVFFYQAQKQILQAQLAEKELDVTRLRQLKTQAELQTLQSKINPHFLYNALNSIASLIHEDAGRAEEMTLKLSRLFRYSINSQQENSTSVREEVEIVNTYLDIEKVRFGDRITFEVAVNPDLLEAFIPRFLIQPLVENALKHGINNKPTGGKLNIVIDGNGAKELMIAIADNGTPFPDDINMGYGLQSTYDKLNLLYGDDYRIQINNAPVKQIKIMIPRIK